MKRSGRLISFILINTLFISAALATPRIEESGPLLPGTSLIAGDPTKNEFFIVADSDKSALQKALTAVKSPNDLKSVKPKVTAKAKTPFKHNNKPFIHKVIVSEGNEVHKKHLHQKVKTAFNHKRPDKAPLLNQTYSQNTSKRKRKAHAYRIARMIAKHSHPHALRKLARRLHQSKKHIHQALVKKRHKVSLKKVVMKLHPNKPKTGELS